VGPQGCPAAHIGYFTAASADAVAENQEQIPGGLEIFLIFRIGKAAEKFSNGENAVRSVICRWVKNDGNRYFGEYKLVEINDEYRIWQRISTEVELATCA
jgi:hypothetical protein